MSYTFFPNPKEESIRTNILCSILTGNYCSQSLSEIKEIIIKLENTDFDLSGEIFTFDGIEYGIVRSI